MGLLEVLLPPSCAGCGRYGDAICSACRSALRRPWDPADRFLAPDPGVVVGESFVVAVAAFAHRDEAQRIIRRLKYGGGRHLADPLARRAQPAFRRLLGVSGPGPLVPVPLHRSRERERGYNQAHLLALALGQEARLPVWPLLVRRRATERQHGLDRATRVRNLRDAMAVLPGPAPPVVVLVDDILTTGATFEACAVILREAGAAAVYGFALAREV
ncbi:MAG TPA: ComF family protein [Candidatus Limnocylindria bacterium]